MVDRGNSSQRRWQRSPATRGTVAGLAAIALALTGCARLPDSGGVHAGISPVAVDPDDLVVIVEGPAPNAAPESIVQGFLQAVQAGASEDFAVARQYLTEAAASDWKPLSAVWIYGAARPPDPVALGDGGQASSEVQVEVTFDLVGAVDATGRYTSVPSTPPGSTFLVSRDGEDRWRISELPPGILLSDAEFAAQFRAGTVYFPDAKGEFLVPDLRWFPRADAATQLVKAFVDGPPSWLGATVSNPVRDGTSADLEATVVEGDVAEVTLGGTAAWATPAERDVIIACLTASLTDQPGIRSVHVQASGLAWKSTGEVELPTRGPRPEGAMRFISVSPDVDGPKDPGEPAEPDQSGDPDRLAAASSPKPLGQKVPKDEGEAGGEPTASPAAALATYGQRLMEYNSGQAAEVPGFEALAQAQLDSLTIAPGGRAIAGLGEVGQVLRIVQNAEAPEVLAEDSGRVAPAYDHSGWLWSGTAGTEAPGLVAFGAAGDPVTLAAKWLTDRQVLAVAPDWSGVRLAVVTRDGAGAVTLEVAAVVREDGGRPVALTDPMLAAVFTQAPVGVVWSSDIDIAVLVPVNEDEPPVPRVITVGGLSSDLRDPGGAGDPSVAITASPTTLEIYVAVSSGALYMRSGARWTALPATVRLPAFPT